MDSGLTPYLLVDATGKGVVVPERHIKDGRIVLNINPGAVKDLQLGNELISFSARFDGAPRAVRIPPQAVLGIYAKEDGRGMLFPDEPGGGSDGSVDEPTPPKSSHDRPGLKLVK
ncbi:MAG: ClpXP protease specificity-enhancing factor SspB [Candidatus Polarisedimenticolaceae bacterium]|nr:ClpXP protease specificity-enhancing factor SspB [Candidatus Polarisedimenticolaceae bacterium]